MKKYRKVIRPMKMATTNLSVLSLISYYVIHKMGKILLLDFVDKMP